MMNPPDADNPYSTVPSGDHSVNRENHRRITGKLQEKSREITEEEEDDLK